MVENTSYLQYSGIHLKYCFVIENTSERITISPLLCLGGFFKLWSPNHLSIFLYMNSDSYALYALVFFSVLSDTFSVQDRGYGQRNHQETDICYNVVDYTAENYCRQSAANLDLAIQMTLYFTHQRPVISIIICRILFALPIPYFSHHINSGIFGHKTSCICVPYILLWLSVHFFFFFLSQM